jgi:hypothetical protein
MKSTLVVLNGNTVNRQGSRFPVAALVHSLDQSWEFGLPSCISHDSHRPIGWSKGLSIYFEPQRVLLVGLIFIPIADNDNEQIRKLHEIYLSKRITVSENLINDHRDKITGYVSGGAKYCRLDSLVVFDKGIAKKIFPDIFSKKDKDGLVPLKYFKQKAPGVFEIDGLLLFAHPYFRRSLSRLNSLNDAFFNVIHDISNGKDVDICLALDEDIIGFADTYLSPIELEYWWGPKFKEDLATIEVGVTRHEANNIQKIYHGISGAEFSFYDRDGIRTFECEELRDIPSFGVSKESFGCRYIHSMVDTNNKLPYHLDGAIRMYTAEEMIARLETNIIKAGKHTEYTKLWRINGLLDIVSWKKVIAHYFRDNHLIGEYLGGIEDSENITPGLIENDASFKLSNYIPCDIQAGDGIRLSLSYRRVRVGQPTDRALEILDSFTKADGAVTKYLDCETINILKILNKLGERTVLPADITWIAFEDQVHNFPLFVHAGKDALRNATATQNAIFALCSAWAKGGNDRLVSYSIGIVYGKREVILSFAGHVNDIVVWKDRGIVDFPPSEDQIAEWSEKVANKLSDIFHNSRKTTLETILKASGLLKIERVFLKPEEYSDPTIDKATGAIKATFHVSREVADALSSGSLKVAPYNIISKSACSKCGNDFFTCKCIKYIDEEVGEIIKAFEQGGLFWTNRHSQL